ncbi:hypothetical protein ABIE33_004936 [Ensifer sp. 4252]
MPDLPVRYLLSPLQWAVEPDHATCDERCGAMA